MPPKDSKKGLRTPTTEKSSSYGEMEDYEVPNSVSVSLFLKGDNPGPGDWIFLIIFNGQTILETKWQNKLILEVEALPINLKEYYDQSLVADRPLIFILRATGGKGAKDPDPLLNIDNRAGGTADLFPLLVGEKEVFVKVHMLTINSGSDTNCRVIVRAKSMRDTENSIETVPLTLTLLSAHCLPTPKDGTVYLSAIGLNGVHDPMSVNFGMSLSNASAAKVLWASASNAGQAANTAYNIPCDDKFIPPDLELKQNENCVSIHWNAMKRVMINPIYLKNRLTSPFLMEVAGVPRIGKIDVRGRYMAFIDAGVLLEPGQSGVTICAKLLLYNELDLPDNTGPLLELPPTSAKTSARETDLITDEYGHSSYIILRFDLFEPLNLKAKIATLYDTIGFSAPGGAVAPVDELYMEPPQEDTKIDIRRIRKECGALSVHKELSGLATRGTVQMTQSIKRTAANRLLLRIRSMLKQFTPEETLLLDWQDTVTAQHAASRRAVISSFAPQPPLPRTSSRVAIARSRLAGDSRIAEQLVEKNIKAAPSHPRILLSKVLRCLEERNETEAQNYLLKGLSAQLRNRFLLWTFGGVNFDKPGATLKAIAAFQIAVNGDGMDGITGAIGWAALHSLYHYHRYSYAAFVAAKKMRKYYELSRDWKRFLQRWVETSGEEETFWIPGTINSSNPMLITAAFFLCLRCYKFSERILDCVETGCAARGSRFNLTFKITSDVTYLRAASLIMRRQLTDALKLTDQGIKTFGPSAIMSQMRATCLTCLRGWDGECESALAEADRAGAELCPTLLLKAASGCLNTNHEVALQFASRAHKIAPSAHSALVIGRIYGKMGEEVLAERWAAAAVKTEPLLADGWAFLALLAMYERNTDKARAMLRTANQVGPISVDIDKTLKKIMKTVCTGALPDALVKNLCLCDYY